MIATNQRLYDISTRIALLIECVKLNESNAFADQVIELQGNIRDILRNLKHSKIGDMTKSELSLLVMNISKVQSKVFNRYSADLLKFLFGLTCFDSVLYKCVLATQWFREIDPTAELCTPDEAYQFFKDEEKDSNLTPYFGWTAVQSRVQFNALWAKIGNAILPANGLTITQFLKAFIDSAQGSVLNAIRASWANDETIDEAINRIVGNPHANVPGALSKVINQGRAVIHTTTQHVSSSVAAAISSALLPTYRWDSVMDSHTTAICISRNGNVYTYGDGPLAPAHIGCRSHTTPLNGSTDDVKQQTLYAWASSQPIAFQRAAFNGDGRTLADIKPLTLDQFASEATTILS